MRRLLLSLPLLLSACAGQTLDSGLPHLTTDRFKHSQPYQWDLERGEMNGAPACVLTSRRDYLQVTTGSMDGKPFAVVGTARSLETGTWMVAKFNGELYRTSLPHFTAAQSQAIIDALKAGETVYVEHISKGTYRGYHRFTDIVTSDNFPELIAQCQTAPKAEKPRKRGKKR